MSVYVRESIRNLWSKILQVPRVQSVGHQSKCVGGSLCVCAYVRVRVCARSCAYVQKDVMGQVTILGSLVPRSGVRET